MPELLGHELHFWPTLMLRLNVRGSKASCWPGSVVLPTSPSTPPGSRRSTAVRMSSASKGQAATRH